MAAAKVEQIYLQVDLENVSQHLIEEWRAFRGTNSGTVHMHSKIDNGELICKYSSSPGHKASNGQINPANPKNRLDAFRKEHKEEGTHSQVGKSMDKKHKNKKEKEILAMELNSKNPNYSTSKIMIDSGTTLHITPYADKVQSWTNCEISISLGDNSIVKSTSQGVRRVRWQGRNGSVNVSLSRTLVVRDVAMSLLSVPAFFRNGHAVLFQPGKALFINFNDDNAVVGQAVQEADRLIYISDNETYAPEDHQGDNKKPFVL